MDPIYVAALGSFLLGAMGYVIVMFWIRPISRYKKTRKKISTDISQCRSLLSQSIDIKGNTIKQQLKSLRKNCSDLVYIYNDDIPNWYRLMLTSRKESPADASGPAMKLSTPSNHEHAIKSLDEIKTHLLLK